jgi:hypothetical protein
MNNNKNNIAVGRYRVSPMAQPRGDGAFDALVSIRSGQGMASVDRVMQFTPSFTSPKGRVAIEPGAARRPTSRWHGRMRGLAS